MDRKVLVTGPVSEKVLKKLQDQGFELDVRALKDLVDGDELIKALKGKHAHIYGGYESMDAKAINSADCLKVIAFVGAGYENFVDVNAATRKGILVTNTPGANTQSVAEMTIGLMLSCMRHIPYLNEGVRQGKWNTSLEGSEIRGKVLGIIGMGNIGKRVAEIAYYGFGMKIVYYSRTIKNPLC